jgi:hypothetical protein
VVDGLTKEQQRFRPAPHRWSVAECVEHVSRVEKLVLQEVQKVVLQPVQPTTFASLSDDVILDGVPQRLLRCASPPEAFPNKRLTEFDQLLRQFEAARERSLRFAATTQSDLRAHSFAHPHLGELDCYQWILFVGAHAERHVRQAEDVMADPGFPGVADSAIA